MDDTFPVSELSILSALAFAVIAAFAAIILIVRARAVRDFALSMIGLIPALPLMVMALVATLFWRVFLWLAALFPLTGSFTKAFKASVTPTRQKSTSSGKAASGKFASIDDDELFTEHAAFTGKRIEMARSVWPEERFPYLYRHVPKDLQRPLFADGRLPGGVPITWLADRHVTQELIERACKAAIAAVLMIVLIPLALYLWTIVSAFAAPLISAFETEPRVIERWPDGSEVTVSRFSYVMEALWLTLLSLIDVLWRGVIHLTGWLLFGTGVGILVAFVVIEQGRRKAAQPYELVTKDSLIRWPYRAEARAIAEKTYIEQIALSSSYLKEAKLFPIGQSTGTLRMRGDFNAPMRGQPLMLDDDSLFQHLMVLGGTGEGKTSAVLKPLLRQFIADSRFGLYICDAKGVLWNDALSIANSANRPGDVVILGTGKDQQGVDVVAGLTPSQVAGVLRSVMTQLGGAASDSFWPDMAASVMRHALTIGRAYAETEHGKALLAGSSGEPLNPYSLWWAYLALQHSDMLDKAIDAVRDASLAQAEAALAEFESLDSRDDAPADGASAILASEEVEASLAYMDGPWREMAERTRSGILASVSQLMDGFSSAPELRRRFVCGLSKDCVPLSAALEGKIVLSALSNIEDGLPARLVNILLKTCLYREARLREAAFKRQGKKPQDKPCIVMMDEVQEIVTVDPASGLSDASFWNVARSTGLIGIFATQTVAALDQAMGEAAARNFLQQARSKIFLRSEDRATLEYACWCAGEFERNRVFEEGQKESIEHRVMVDGWSPFAPITKDDELSIQNGFKLLMDAALMLISAKRRRFSEASARPVYAPDLRFVPKTSFFMDANRSFQVSMAQISAEQAAYWRAEDLERKFRAEGNSLQPALMPADMIGLGRWHAYALIQRAGAARQDIISLKHDHG
mgnify:CR=1 FL=1